MEQLNRIRDARRNTQQAAIERWQRRESERARNKQVVAAGGVGAADSPQRNARFRARAAGFDEARRLRRLGLLPFGLERKMGPTLDYTPYAPSDAARTAGRPVARIVALGGPGLQPEGFATGFLVSPRLLLTNHHVFPTRSDAVGMGANFLYERTERGLQNGMVFEVDPAAFYASDERLDYALVGVKPRSTDGQTIDGFGVAALIEAMPKILIGQRVNIIQYPEGGPKQYAVSQNRLVDILDDGFLHYETDTLEGSSGAPAFSETWELVALHHAAIPELRDGKYVAIDGSLWEPEMGDDRVHWIANEGTRVSAIVKHLSGQRLETPEMQALLDDLLAGTTDPIDDLADQMTGGSATNSAPEITPTVPSASVRIGGPAMASNIFNFSGPVTIHVYTSQETVVPLPTPSLVEPEPAPALEASLRFDRHYENREGYDIDFLDPRHQQLVVPMPSLTADRRAEALKDDQGEPLLLKYHHFALVMSERRRLQLWSAANVDYNPARKTRRAGGRDAFGRDRWIPDPRIPARAQIFDAELYKPAGNIDRGHIVRRDDNAWGESETEIEFANSDTFHWTNCTPQHEAFNQSDPGRSDPTYQGLKGIWGDFENHIQQTLRGVDSRACILAGPVLDHAKDPSADFGSGPIQYPLRFWKVVAVTVPADAGRRALRVFGFVLSQKPVVDRFGIEAFGPGKFRRYQVPLRKITELTGVIFDDVLHTADTLRGEHNVLPITAPAQIRSLHDGRLAPTVQEDPDI